MFESIRGLINRTYDYFNLAVTPVPVGLPNDGLTRSGTNYPYINKSELYRQSAVLIKSNPLYKKAMITIIANVLGTGFSYHAEEKLTQYINVITSNMFFDKFLSQALQELVRTGDLFIAVHILKDNIELRIIPTATIDEVITAEGDYTVELEYLQNVVGYDSKKWLSWNNPQRDNIFVYHYNINALAGEVRGFGEFAAAHVWMNRYDRLLKDRVHINVSLKSFLWIFSIPQKYWETFKNKFSSPPETGSTLILPEGVEVSTVSPNIGAKDFSHDRIALLEMISSGTSGLTPLDFGDLNTSNLSTAQIASNNKAIIMRRLQKNFFDFITFVLIYSVNVFARTQFKATDLSIHLHPIDYRSIKDVMSASADIAKVFKDFVDTFGDTPELRTLLLNLFIKTSNISISEEDFIAIILGKVNDGE